MTASHTSARFVIAALMIAWGSTYAITRALLETLPPFTTGFLRFAIASAVLLPLAARALARLEWRRDGASIAGTAFFGIGAYYAGFNTALSLAGAAQGAIIQALCPAAVALAAWLWLREPLPRLRAAGIALSFVGVVLAVDARGEGRAPLLGALLMGTTVLAWVGYTLLAKRLAQVDALASTAAMCAIGTLMLAPFAAIEWARGGWPTLDANAAWSLAWLGLVASAAGYLAYNWTLKHLEAGEVAVWISLVPVVGVAAAVLGLGERFGTLQALGATLAIAGVLLALRAR